jgi:hypothetical protein
LSSSIWVILAFKVPLVALIGLLIWWASRGESAQEDETGSDDDGGIRRHTRPHPRRPFPRHPRRGPHGGAGGDRFAPPARVRTVRARARSLGH